MGSAEGTKWTLYQGRNDQGQSLPPAGKAQCRAPSPAPQCLTAQPRNPLLWGQRGESDLLPGKSLAFSPLLAAAGEVASQAPRCLGRHPGLPITLPRHRTPSWDVAPSPGPSRAAPHWPPLSPAGSMQVVPPTRGTTRGHTRGTLFRAAGPSGSRALDTGTTPRVMACPGGTGLPEVFRGSCPACLSLSGLGDACGNKREGLL